MKDFQTVAIISENHKPKGNYLPRERVLVARVARAISTSYSQHPWYVVLDIQKSTRSVKGVTEKDAVKYNQKPSSQKQESNVTLVGQKKSTRHCKYMKNISTTKTMETSRKSTQKNYKTLTCLSEDFLAKAFQSPERGVVSATQGALSFLKSLGLLGKNNHACYCLRTSKGFYLTTRGKHYLHA